METKKIEKAVRDILVAIGEDIHREGLEQTPSRIASSYEEIFSGIAQDPRAIFERAFSAEGQNLVLEKGIDFYSMCEHHFLPFFGKIDVAYIPKKKILGFGDIIKLIDILARRPQIQERLTEELASFLYEGLDCEGVFIRMEAKHLCMTMRGAKRENTKIVSIAGKGCFQEGEAKRMEVLYLLKD